MTTRDGLIGMAEAHLCDGQWSAAMENETLRALITLAKRAEGVREALKRIQVATGGDWELFRTAGGVAGIQRIARAALSDPSAMTDADQIEDAPDPTNPIAPTEEPGWTDAPTPPQGAWPDDAAVKRAIGALYDDPDAEASEHRPEIMLRVRTVLLAAGPPPSPEPVTDGEVVVAYDAFEQSRGGMRSALTAFLALRLGRV